MDLTPSDIASLKKVAALFPEGKPAVSKKELKREVVKDFKRKILMDHLKKMKQ